MILVTDRYHTRRALYTFRKIMPDKQIYVSPAYNASYDEAHWWKTENGFTAVFEETLASMKQMLKEAEDPNNEQFAAYRESYPGMVEMNDQAYQRQLEEWQLKFPENKNEYIKVRLREFIDLANDIDYSATLVEKDGKKVFQNSAYESKDYRWKLGYRTGKELMDIAKGFAGDWLKELE